MRMLFVDVTSSVWISWVIIYENAKVIFADDSVYWGPSRGSISLMIDNPRYWMVLSQKGSLLERGKVHHQT